MAQIVNVYFSQFWMLEVQDQGASRYQGLVKVHFLVHRQHSHHVLTNWGDFWAVHPPESES